MLAEKQARNFIEKINFYSENGCLEWLGALDTGGYGIFGVNGKLEKAHRVAWTHIKGKIPEGLYALHKCDNRKCVNPDHLYIGNDQDNMNDKVARRRHHAHGKTHCKRGHEFNTENTKWYINKKTKNWARQCRRCGNITDAISQRKRRAQAKKG